MPKFVITEIWTRTRVVDAPNQEAALEQGEPVNFPFRVKSVQFNIDAEDLELNLSNWHATEVK